MAAVETPAQEPILGSEDERWAGVGDPGPQEWADDHEPLPLEALLDSEPDSDDAWELVPVSEADIDFTAPEGEAEGEAAAREPQDKRSAREDEHEARQDAGGQDEPLLPVHSTRSEAQGARGCWALNSKGDPCGAAKLKEADYCAAHSGKGLAADPARYAPLGQEASKRARAVRAEMRLSLGVTRPNSPRGVLKARAFAERERLAARAIEGALADPKLALRLIEAVDPAPRAEIQVSGPVSVDDVGGMSLSQLQALAVSMGISTNPSPPALPE